ncbi:MAG: flagellin [Lachnospiraceae bacterium]|nr:flagellin [Lachnospiraceae bacterium]
MSGVTGISAQNTYANLSSGSRINKAADDASGLAISEKLKSQATGFEVGAENANDGVSMMNIADGALSGIQDSLQRMRELAVKASNGLYSAEDKSYIQKEIDGLKQTIQETAQRTSFNEMTLLDGSKADVDLATNPSGGGLSIQMVNSTLESLGIADFDVTGKFNLEDIDKAMEKVSEARSSLGAQTNALGHTISYNKIADYNLTAADSRIRDTDYAEEIINKNREEILQKYRIFGIQAKKDADAGILKLF